MKISAIHGFLAKSKYSQVQAQSNPIAPNYNMNGFNQLKNDTVSFGQTSSAGGFENDGLNSERAYLADLNSRFDVKTVKNSGGERKMVTFDFNMGNGIARLFGDEEVLAKHTSNKRLDNFDARSDDKKNYISYNEGRYKYSLTYLKETGELTKGKVEFGSMTDNSYKCFTLSESRKTPGKFVGHYELQSAEGGKISHENTKLLFDEKMKIEKCVVSKRTEYSNLTSTYGYDKGEGSGDYDVCYLQTESMS